MVAFLCQNRKIKFSQSSYIGRITHQASSYNSRVVVDQPLGYTVKVIRINYLGAALIVPECKLGIRIGCVVIRCKTFTAGSSLLVDVVSARSFCSEFIFLIREIRKGKYRCLA